MVVVWCWLQTAVAPVSVELAEHAPFFSVLFYAFWLQLLTVPAAIVAIAQAANNETVDSRMTGLAATVHLVTSWDILTIG